MYSQSNYESSYADSSEAESYAFSEISGAISKLTIMKQDPSTLGGQTIEILLSDIENGPRNRDLYNATFDAQVNKNKNNDFTPKHGTKGFGAVSAFGCGALALKMIDRDVNELSSMTQSKRFKKVFENWEERGILALVLDRAPGTPAALYRKTQNGGQVILNSFYSKDHKRVVHSYLSSDIVIHEVGHYILDVLCPKFTDIDRPQTKALHESWADLLVIFTILDQSDLRNDLLKLTKGDLSQKSFLPTIAEEFGVTLEHNRNGLRNAAERIDMDNVEKDIHSFSQVFTGAIYDLLAVVFRDRYLQTNQTKKMEEVLEQVAKDIRYLILLTFIEMGFSDPSFSDMRKLMKIISRDNPQFNYLSDYIPRIFKDRRILFIRGHSRMDEYDYEIQANHPKTYGAEFSLCKTCHKGFHC